MHRAVRVRVADGVVMDWNGWTGTQIQHDDSGPCSPEGAGYQSLGIHEWGTTTPTLFLFFVYFSFFWLISLYSSFLLHWDSLRFDLWFRQMLCE